MPAKTPAKPPSKPARKRPAAPAGEKLDLYKKHAAEYAARREPSIVKMGPAVYLAIEGQGEPGGAAFQTAIGALYGMAWTIKMTRKFAGRGDYVVCKLEAVYWGDQCDWWAQPPATWRWKMLIRTPGAIGARDLAAARRALEEKGKGEATDRVQLEKIEEGPCVQMLHVGPYEKETESIAAMAAFAETQGREFHGRHHEIYLSDPRRVAPEKLKTILRIPVKAR